MKTMNSIRFLPVVAAALVLGGASLAAAGDLGAPMSPINQVNDAALA